MYPPPRPARRALLRGALGLGAAGALAGLADDLLPARTAPYSRDGKIYALDSDTPMVVYYYRDDLFTEYRLPADTPTWEEFAELGARAHQDHGASLCVVATGSDVGQVVASFQMLLYQRGGALFDADQRLVLDSPEAEEALTLQTALKQRKVIGLPMATWYKSYGLMPNVPEQSGRWRIRALPRFANGGGRTATLGGTGFGVIKDKANTRAATEFLLNTWLTHDGQVRRYTDIGYLPTRRSVYQDPRLHALKDRSAADSACSVSTGSCCPRCRPSTRAPTSRSSTTCSAATCCAPTAATSPRARRSSRPPKTSATMPVGQEEDTTMTTTLAGTARTTGTRAARRGAAPRPRGPRAPYLFIAPFYLLYVLFMLVPIAVSLWLSLAEWVGLGSPHWVGLRNYRLLATDASFQRAIGNTGVYVLIAVCVVVPLALLIAQALNTRGLRRPVADGVLRPHRGVPDHRGDRLRPDLRPAVRAAELRAARPAVRARLRRQPALQPPARHREGLRMSTFAAAVRARSGRALLYATLLLLLLAFLAPLLWALSGSFKPRGDIFGYPPKLIPDRFTFDNYRHLVDQQPFWRWFLMSTGVAAIATVVSVFVCALAGYGFAKFRFAGRRLLFGVMFSSLSIPFAVILVPLFVILVKTGLGSPWFALIVPWVTPAFGIFMMQQYIVQSVPDSVLEAARIDGASEFGIFWRIVLPLLRPSLGALAVWTFLQSYNSFLWPLVLVSDSAQYTLPLGLQTLFVSENRQYDLVMAGAVLAVVPAVALFVLLRKQLLEGLSTGAVKG